MQNSRSHLYSRVRKYSNVYRSVIFSVCGELEYCWLDYIHSTQYKSFWKA